LKNFVNKEFSLMQFTSLVSPVLEFMKYKAGEEYDSDIISVFEDVLMLVYSSHDHQITLLMDTLRPTNYEFKWVNYASSILFELHLNDTQESGLNQQWDTDNEESNKSSSCNSTYVNFHLFNFFLVVNFTNRKYYIDMYYVDNVAAAEKNKSKIYNIEDGFTLLQLPGCSSVHCPFDEFVAYLESLFVAKE